MEIIANAGNIHVSPRKMRPVVDLVKKMPVQKAVTTLQFLPKSSAKPVLKALKSAVANAKTNQKLDEANLKIKNILVDQGHWFSRKYDHSHGVRHGLSLIRRRASHLKVILEG